MFQSRTGAMPFRYMTLNSTQILAMIGLMPSNCQQNALDTEGQVDYLVTVGRRQGRIPKGVVPKADLGTGCQVLQLLPGVEGLYVPR